MKKHKIVEKFYSIQSEGVHAGTASTFIRFYGCNLKCVFAKGLKCDEPLHVMPKEVVMHSDEDIVDFCKAGTPKHVVITGGEPSLNDLNELIGKLRDAGLYVCIETNGTNFDNIKKANWITYSPKFSFDPKAPKMQYGFHELKLLASEEFPPDIQAWATVVNKFVQPIGLEKGWNLDNVRWCHEFVVSNPSWKLSLQTHKIYGAD